MRRECGGRSGTVAMGEKACWFDRQEVWDFANVAETRVEKGEGWMGVLPVFTLGTFGKTVSTLENSPGTFVFSVSTFVFPANVRAGTG